MDRTDSPLPEAGALWWGWTQIPPSFRKSIYRWLQRKEKDEKR